MVMKVEGQEEQLLPAIFRDARIIRGIAQLIFVVIVVIVLNDLQARINTALESTNQSPNFEFLQNRAGFDLADSGSYSSNDRYIDAFQVGFINTLRVVLLGLASTTVIGIMVGIFLLSRNFLLRTISRVYVEVLRNTPVLLQIFAWFYIVLFSLPPQQESIAFPQEGIRSLPLLQYGLSLFIVLLIWQYSGSLRRPAWRNGLRQVGIAVVLLVNLLGIVIVGAGTPIEFRPGIYVSIKGVAIFELIPTSLFGIWMVFVVIGAVVSVAMSRYFAFITESSGQPIPRTRYALAAFAGFTLLGWLIIGMRPTPSQIAVYEDDRDEFVEMEYEEAFESGLMTIEQELEYTRQPLIFRPPTLDRRGRNIETGIEFRPSYLAIFLGLGHLHLGLHRRDCAGRHPGGSQRAAGSVARPRAVAGRYAAPDHLAAGAARHHPAAGQSVLESLQKFQLGDRRGLHRYLSGDVHDNQSVGSIGDRHRDGYAFILVD